MEIPRDSAIAMSTTQQREQNKAEQERLKRLVLNYEEREEELDKQGELSSLSLHLLRLRD
jgi:regulator of nonsense transcripts 2